VYFALLHLGRRSEAFALYLHDRDRRRLEAVFGAAAHTSPALERTPGDCFVIPQDGPGDEIALAATYPTLVASTSGSVHAACDPRLTSVLERSFPHVTFHPVERLSSRPIRGFLAAGRPRRAPDSFYDLLTAEAHDVARASSRVILGRSLLALGDGRAPFGGYLVADESTMSRVRPQIPGDAIGVVWRSEFADAARSIHFVQPSDLSPLRRLGRPIVSLQHDATDEELDRLAAAVGDVVVPSGVDLRNDFESMLGVVACCTDVVGVGTTMVELAGAAGVPTIYLHPNVIGAWRIDGNGVDDYWHGSMRGAVADHPTAPATCVVRAYELLAFTGRERLPQGASASDRR